MRPRRGKVAALATMAAAIAVAAAALWRPLREEWYLHELASGDPEVVQTAARRLGEMKCYRAIPKLAHVFTSQSPFSTYPPDFSLENALDALDGPGAVPFLEEALGGAALRVREWATRRIGRADRWGARSFGALVAAVSDPEEVVRGCAARELAQFGRKAVPSLAKALEDGSIGVRIAAAAALQELGPLGVEAAPELRQVVRRDDGDALQADLKAFAAMDFDAARVVAEELGFEAPDVLRWAVRELGGDLRSAPGAVPGFLRALDGGDGPERERAADALREGAARDPRVIEALLARLGGPDLVFEGKIRSGLLEAGESAVPGLIAALRREGAPARFSALSVLEALGEKASDAVPALEECLRDPDEDLRERANQVLAEVRPGRKGDIDFLIATLEDKTEESPLEAARLLGGLGPLARSALEPLAAALARGSLPVRIAAAAAIARIQVESAPDLSFLLEALDGKKGPEAAAPAAEALGRIGPRAKAAVSRLLRGLDDANLAPRSALALLEIEPQALLEAAKRPGDAGWPGVLRALSGESLDGRAVPLLVRALESPDVSIVVSAATVLRDIGPGAAPAVPALRRLLVDDDAYARSVAFDALGGIGEAAAPALLEALSRPSRDLDAEAIAALARIGPAAAPAVPALLARLRESPPSVQVAVARALAAIGAAAVDGLACALRDPSADVRSLAAFALGRIGPAARPALKALRAALGDADATVRRWAERAIEKVAPEE